MLGAILGTRDSTVHKKDQKKSCLHGANIQVKDTNKIKMEGK